MVLAPRAKSDLGQNHRTGPQDLFHYLESSTLTVTGGRTRQQRPNRLNSLTIAADNSSNVCLAQLHSENCHLPRWNLGEHHLIRKFDQLTNDEFQKLFHNFEAIQTSRF